MTGSRPVAVLVCALILVCGACDWSAEKYAPRQEKEFARAYLDSVRAGNIEAARRHLHPTLDTPDCDAKLLAIAQSFPSGKLIEARTIGFRIVEYESEKIAEISLAFQYEFEDGWVVAKMALEKSEQGTFVKGLNITPRSQSLQSLNAFTLEGKRRKHYTFFVLAIVIPIFIVLSFLTCLRTPMRHGKWLWAIFTLLGIGTVSLNWTTGQMTIEPVAVRLLGMRAGWVDQYAPFVITLSVPLGAIVFLAKRKTLVYRGNRKPR